MSNRGGSGHIDLVVFDMDGVLFEGRNFWLDLHRHYSTEREALELAERYLKTDYAELGRVTAEQLWKGRPAEPFHSLVRARRYQAGVWELFAALHLRGVRTAIVSSGPRELAERAQRDLGIDTVRANSVDIIDGVITGKLRIEVPDPEKPEVAASVMEELGTAPEHVAAVGDTTSDIGVLKAVGLAIAYDSDSGQLDEIADVRLQKGDLLKIVDILDARRRGS